MANEDVMKLEAIVTNRAETVYQADYITDDNLPERRIEALGTLISVWSEWDGVLIMQVFAAALTDANFHQESKQVHDMIANVLSE